MPRPIPIDEFLLDPQNECLWRGEESIPLRPKTYALLRYLVGHPGRILSKDELLDAVWPDAIVGDAVLKVCVRELRKALGDRTADPRFIETVHRRGYRWRAAAAPDPDAVAEPETAASPPRTVAASGEGGGAAVEVADLVGRADELGQLRRALDGAAGGARQVVLISGEPGVGKTALCQRFLAELATDAARVVARGQCLEHFGTGEAYAPFLEALTAMAAGPSGPDLKRLLRSFAPTWLAQLPALTPDSEERRALERELFGATQGRMIREMSDALDALAADRTVVLLLEDLHWADPSTVDLLGAIAHRSTAARLLVLGTVRPVDLIVHSHPLRRLARDLESRALCRELRLTRLDLDGSRGLIERILDSTAPPRELCEWIHARTHGNPLFTLNLVGSLRERAQIVLDGDRWTVAGELDDEHVPEGVVTLLEEMVERLDTADRRLLEAASVAGAEFSSGAVAAILDTDQDEIEERFASLARSSHLIDSLGGGTFPDGTPVERYHFTHALYVVALQRQIPATRRRRLHERYAERGVTAYGSEVRQIAAELADQFERAGRGERAANLYTVAAEECVRRFALREAEQHLEHALECCPDDEAEVRLAVLERLGLLRRARGSFDTSADAFAALAAAAEDTGHVEHLVHARLYEASVASWLGRERCLAAIEGAERASRALPEGPLLAHTRGATAYWQLLWEGRTDRAAAANEDARRAARAAGARDLEAFHTVRSAWFGWLGGETAGAVEAAREGAGLCVEVGDWFDYLLSRFFLGWTLLHEGSWGELRGVLAESSALAERNGHAPWSVLFALLDSWLHMEARDFEGARALVADVERRSADLGNPFIAQFARTIGGLARQGVGDLDGARADFEAVLGPEADDVLMGWILRLVAGSGLSRLQFATADLDAAAATAERVIEVAEDAGERTAAAVGRRTLAEIAVQRGDAATADAEIGRALDHLIGEPTPLADWRVHLSAAEIRGRDDRVVAERHRREARRIAEGLAASLAADDPLRSKLLDNPDFDPAPSGPS